MGMDPSVEGARIAWTLTSPSLVIRGFFNVPVDDAFGVSRVQCIGNLDGHFEEMLQLHRAVPDVMLQRLTVEILHSDNGLTIFLADVINRADVGVVERRGGLGFTSKSL